MFSFFIDFNFQNPPSQWCRLATIKCSKAFLALKPLYCDQSTKLTQLIKPNYFVILLYWYSTSSLRKLPHLFLRESLILILCSCLLLNQNISMFWCFFLLNDFQSFFLDEPIKWTWICSFLNFLFFKGTYLQVCISMRTYRGKHKGHLMEKSTFGSLTQNLKWERKLCERWHAHLPMVRINMTTLD